MPFLPSMYKNCQRQEDYVEPAKSVMSEWLAGSLRDLPLSINKSHARERQTPGRKPKKPFQPQLMTINKCAVFSLLSNQGNFILGIPCYYFCPNTLRNVKKKRFCTWHHNVSNCRKWIDMKLLVSARISSTWKSNAIIDMRLFFCRIRETPETLWERWKFVHQIEGNRRWMTSSQVFHYKFQIPWPAW